MSKKNQLSETDIIIAIIGGISIERATDYCAWLHREYPNGVSVIAVRNDFHKFNART